MSHRRLNRSKRKTKSQPGVSHVSAEQLEPRLCLSAVNADALFVPNEVLVQYESGTSPASRADARAAVGAEVRQVIHTRTMQRAGNGVLERVELPGNMTVEAATKMFAANPHVRFAEPNYVYQPAIANDPSYTNGSLWGMYSDDQTTPVGPPGTTNQYGSQAEKAWDAGFIGSSSVVIGVIDEGIDINHPDLAANIWTNPGEIPGNGIDDDGNGYVDDMHGWDFFNNDASVFDGSGDDHGTHVAGTIGGVGNNSTGVAGVAWDTTMISAKFLGPNGGSTADAVLAVDYLTDLKLNYGVNVKATNNSWGGGGYSQTLFDAIDRADQADILFIAAAGNGGVNNDLSPHYPSSYTNQNVIAVAALNSSGSNIYSYGPVSVDIGAPGGGVRSTLPFNSYGSYSGTSMATPHVAGAVALYASEYPTATASEIRNAILSTAAPTAGLNGLVATNGRLDAFAAVLSGNPPGVQVNLDAVDAAIAEGNSGVTTFNFTIAMDEPSTTPDSITVNWILDLANSVADANDFAASTATSGSVTFATPQDPATLTQTISFDVLGDIDVEVDEAFSVVLTNTTGGDLGRATATSTILGDDALIEGTVWNDLNQSGSQDAGDVPFAGLTAYVDANDDGQLSAGEVSVVTDANGVYSLPVAPGQHVVRLLLAANQEQTFPLLDIGNVEPDDSAAGTVLNTVSSPDVTLSGVGASVANNNVVAQATTYVSTGSLSFGSSWNGGLWNTGDAELRADFDSPTSSVSIDFISDDASDFGHMRAYNASGSLLAEYVTSDLGTGAVETMTINRPSNDIAYVLASGRNGQFGFLDNLTYSRMGTGTPVPIRLTVGPEVASANDFGAFETIANNPPVAGDDPVSTAEDQSVIANVLGNDEDPDQDPITISSFTNPSNGTVTDNGDGTLTYAPNADFNGSDSFMYTISDGKGGFDTGTVTVTVEPVNDAPIAVPDNASTDVATSVVISVLGNDIDVDGDNLQISSFTTTTLFGGTVAENEDGTLTYTPLATFSGEDSFDYEVTDGELSDIATVTIDVTLPPGSITVTPTSLTTIENGNAKAFVITLGTVPTEDVTISITSSDTTEGVTDVSEIVFAAGSQGPMTVTVNPVDDLLAGSLDGPQTYTIVTGAAVSNDAAYNGLDVADVTVTNNDDDQPNAVDVLASSEETIHGSKVGDHTLTFVDDSTSEILTEEETAVTGGGKPKLGSVLDHRWTFAGLSDATSFTVDAFRDNNTDGDNFAFEYSTNGGASWTLLDTVDSATPNTYTVSVPSLSGDVVVRVRDTDRSPANGRSVPELNSLQVDYMAFQSLQEDFRPAVTITAVDALANENPSEPGVFRIERVEATSEPLVVDYSLSGSAEQGSDYEWLYASTEAFGTVTILANETFVDVVIVPRDDGTEEGNESVVLTLAERPAYQISGGASANVTIADDDLLLFVATADLGGQGTVEGDYTLTHTDNGVSQNIVERESGGKPANRHTHLSGTWQFDVGTTNVNSFILDASTTGTIDRFRFEYSTDNNTFVSFSTPIEISNTTSGPITVAVPGLSGAIYVRVTDTDQTSGERTAETISVDFMAFSTAPVGNGSNAASNSDSSSSFKGDLTPSFGRGSGQSSQSSSDSATLSTASSSLSEEMRLLAGGGSSAVSAVIPNAGVENTESSSDLSEIGQPSIASDARDRSSQQSIDEVFGATMLLSDDLDSI